jgi:NADPH2:quinone reductase
MLKRKGTLVSVGNASGAVPPMAPLKLMPKNLKLLRPTYEGRPISSLFFLLNTFDSVGNYLTEPKEAREYGSQLMELIANGSLKINIHKEYSFDAEVRVLSFGSLNIVADYWSCCAVSPASPEGPGWRKDHR